MIIASLLLTWIFFGAAVVEGHLMIYYEHACIEQFLENEDRLDTKSTSCNRCPWEWTSNPIAMQSFGEDWELYTEKDFKGERMTVKKSTVEVTIPSAVGWMVEKKHSLPRKYSYRLPESARPIVTCDYDETGELWLFSKADLQGTRTIIKSSLPQMGDGWYKNHFGANDIKEGSAIARRGNWELFTKFEYSHSAKRLKENMYTDLSEIGWTLKSVRPLDCGSKNKATLVSVTINNEGLGEPTLQGTQIIGSVTGATCHGQGNEHELELSRSILHEDSTEIELITTEGESVDWSLGSTASLELGPLTSSLSVAEGMENSKAFSTTKGTGSTEETEQEIKGSSSYNGPGAGLLFGTVDIYSIKERDVATTLLFEYANGTQFEREGTVQLEGKRYQSVKFWNLGGTWTTDQCKNDPQRVRCVEKIVSDYPSGIIDDTVASGQKHKIQERFEKCFAENM